MSEDESARHGFVAVPVDHSKLLQSSQARQNAPKPIPADAFAQPGSDVAVEMTAYAREHLPRETFNHSMRVYCYGLALLPYLSAAFRPLAHETWYLSCLFHDIGNTPRNLRGTSMSFEFKGGIIAHNVLTQLHAARPSDGSLPQQADAVAEAVIRHQDLGSAGQIPALGALLQLATIVDNTGQFAEFVHRETVETVVRLWPRLGWSACFAATVREEGRLKPWAHTTKMGVEEFAGQIEGNDLMIKYE